jgi:hypothetical protein
MPKDWKTMTYAAALVAVIIFIAAFGAYSGAHLDTKIGPPDPYLDQYKAQDQRNLIQNLVHGGCSPTGYDCSDQHQPKSTVALSPEERTADYTFWMALIGTIQAGLFIWQLILLRKGTEDSKIAAEAAKESADISRVAMISTERAFVQLNTFRWISHRDSESSKIYWRIHPIFTNTGNTPTRKMKLRVKFEIRDSELPEDFDFSVKDGDKISQTLLAPDCVIEGMSIDIWGSDLLKISRREKFFYVWGLVEYNDVFKGTPIHITKFCNTITMVTGDPNLPFHAENNIFGMAFTIYHKHNCADEDCENY